MTLGKISLCLSLRLTKLRQAKLSSVTKCILSFYLNIILINYILHTRFQGSRGNYTFTSEQKVKKQYFKANFISKFSHHQISKVLQVRST